MADQTRSGPSGSSLLLISDFNLGNLAGLLRNSPAIPGIFPVPAPFGEVVRPLLEEKAEGEELRGALVWTRPQAVVPSFGRILAHQEVSSDTLLAEVDSFCDLLIGAAGRFRFLLVPTWSAEGHRGLGMLDLRSDSGIGLALLRMNLRLAERLREHSGLFLLDSSRWSDPSGSAEGSRFWYLAKIPFSTPVFRSAAADIAAAIRGISGQARKMVVVDLDDTLWGGVVGDTGWENLRLGGHDPIGEAFVDFQRELRNLTHRGIILGVVSKNTESVALEAMRSHPEMVLRPEDFAGWRINWSDKAGNLLELAREVNLGLDSIVFLDDHPGERARVRSALPEVLVPEWPEDPLRYVDHLRSLDCFDTPSLSQEDVARAKMYHSERERRQSLESVGSMDEWLRSLEIRVQWERLSDANLQRAAQLLNKTNQMNLSTRRMTEGELRGWSDSEGRDFWTVRVEDRFGDYGLTGLVSLESEGDEGRIVDFVLSCRVFGRRVEETMVHIVASHARERGLARLRAHYLPTAKNAPCIEFWRERSGFTASEEGDLFTFDLADDYPMPEYVHPATGAGSATGASPAVDGSNP